MANYMGIQIIIDVGWDKSVRQLGEVKTLTVTPENSKK